MAAHPRSPHPFLRALVSAGVAMIQPVYDRLRDWLDRNDEIAWTLDARERFPVGALVRCDCSGCGGRVWRVHGYDVEERQIRVIEPRTPINCPWPPPVEFEATWMSTAPTAPVKIVGAA